MNDVGECDFINQFSFNSPTIPVVANVTAKPYQANEIHSLLAEQITHSVRWTQSIDYLLNHGESVFEEIGPGKVLAGLITRIQKNNKHLAISSQ